MSPASPVAVDRPAGPPAGGPADRALHRGLVSALVAAVLAVLAAVVARWAPRGVLLVVVVPLDVLVALAWLALVALPARALGVVLAAAVGTGASLVLTLEHPATLGALAGALGLGVVGAVVGQIVRVDRTHVTDVVAAHCTAVVLAAGVAALCAVRGTRGGAVAAGTGLGCLAAALLVGALVDHLVDRSAGRVRLGPATAGRTLLGAALALTAAAALGALLHGGDGAALGAVAGGVAVLGDGSVAVLAGGRRVARPLAVLVPAALLGPPLFVVTRVLFG